MRRLLLVAAACLPAVAVLPVLAADDVENPVVAIVDGQKIHRSDVEAERQALPQQYRQLPLDAIYEPLLTRIIDQRLLSAAAEKDDIAERPEVKEAVEAARRGVLRDQYIQIAIEEGMSEERLQQAYNAMRQQPGFAFEEVRAHHILVDSEEEAKKIIEELKSGADFAELAKSKSSDPSAANNAGDLGWFRREMMVPEFSEAAFSIEPGTVGETPVKTQFGWHVIKVDERRSRVPSFEEKEPELREQVARDIVTALLTEARSNAQIERFNLDGSPTATEN
jgi:peptidyl-prolyl cis-trans isomerase C